MKVVRSLWDTGASVSLISARVAKVLGLVSIGKSGVSGYNEGIDVLRSCVTSDGRHRDQHHGDGV